MNDVDDAVHSEIRFALDSGAVLERADIAYLTRGRLDAAGDNAVLVTHGYTSSHRFVADGGAGAEGSWSSLVGPGRAIDTDRWFVVASNVLGSSYGSTGPSSLDPATGRAYGPDFPAIGFADIVRLQRRLLDALGVKQLHAVAGVSMGGYQALQWGLQYPGFVRRLVVALSDLRGGDPARVDTLRARLAEDPNWNGGRPAPGAMHATLQKMRTDTLRQYGMARWLQDQPLTDAQRTERLAEMADRWAQGFDANALLALMGAIGRFDVREAVKGLRIPLLYVLCNTDLLFPARKGPAQVDTLRAAGVDARFFEIDSPYGHLASGLDAGKWAGVLREFLG